MTKCPKLTTFKDLTIFTLSLSNQLPWDRNIGIASNLLRYIEINVYYLYHFRYQQIGYLMCIFSDSRSSECPGLSGSPEAQDPAADRGPAAAGAPHGRHNAHGLLVQQPHVQGARWGTRLLHSGLADGHAQQVNVDILKI